MASAFSVYVLALALHREQILHRKFCLHRQGIALLVTNDRATVEAKLFTERGLRELQPRARALHELGVGLRARLHFVRCIPSVNVAGATIVTSGDMAQG